MKIKLSAFTHPKACAHEKAAASHLAAARRAGTYARKKDYTFRARVNMRAARAYQNGEPLLRITR